MDNCYNCENLTIEEHQDYMGYEIWCSVNCKYCDMRIKNHSTPCDHHKPGEPKHITYDVKPNK